MTSAIATTQPAVLVTMGDFAIPSQQGAQLYPALQVSTYRPGADSKPVWVFSPDSAALFSESAQLLLQLKSVTCHYNDSVEMLQPAADFRFAVLAYPKTFTQNKDTKAIDFLREGVKFKENGLVSVVKLLLCPIVDGQPLEDDNGVPQAITLKLTSTRAGLIKSKDAGAVTLDRLNRDLLKTAKKSSGWLLQLASIGISPIVRKISSSTDPKLSSMAIDFALDTAIPLDSSHWAGMAAFAQSQAILDYNANPFNIKANANSFDVLDSEIEF